MSYFLYLCRYLLKAIGLLSLLGLVLANPDPPTEFQNMLEGPLSFECRKGFGLFRVQSVYGEEMASGDVGPGKRNIESDRQWLWECRRVSVSCWSTALAAYKFLMNLPALYLSKKKP